MGGGTLKGRSGFYLSNLRRACGEIWEGYKLYAQGAAVIRTGYELTGLSGHIDSSPFDFVGTFSYRGESILEHQAKVAWLASVFMWADKGLDIFGCDDNNDVDICARASSRMVVALCHDVGECSIGDIPDDGRAEHDNKDAVELEVFEKMSWAYSMLGYHLRWDFPHFQAKDNHGGQALYALDKLEAVLNLINLEGRGAIGSIKLKPEATAADDYYMKMTGSDNPVDCWAAHMRAQIMDFPRDITEPVLTLLDVAINDVRDKSFDWWDKEIPPFESK